MKVILYQRYDSYGQIYYSAYREVGDVITNDMREADALPDTLEIEVPDIKE